MSERMNELRARFAAMKERGLLDLKFDFKPLAPGTTVDDVCREVIAILDAVESAPLVHHRFNDSHRASQTPPPRDELAEALKEIGFGKDGATPREINQDEIDSLLGFDEGEDNSSQMPPQAVTREDIARVLAGFHGWDFDKLQTWHNAVDGQLRYLERADAILALLAEKPAPTPTPLTDEERWIVERRRTQAP